MNKNLLTLGLATSCVLMSAASAQAFTFNTNFTGAPPKGDVFLDSIQVVGGDLIDDFVYVSEVNIVENDEFDGGNTGAASADKGDKATTGVKVEDPSNSDILTNLNNNNLNNIVDTEDNGSFKIDLTFQKAVSSLLFWERGGNSKLEVWVDGLMVTLDSDNPFAVGSKTNETFTYAGFDIDTLEIGGAQSVFSYGLSLADLGLEKATTIRVISRGASFNGPDFKVVGVAAVPEPATMLGLGVVAGAGFLASRRKRAEA